MDFFDLAEVIIMFVWIFAVFVLPRILKSRRKNRPQHEYPEFPETEKPKEISDEERKLKEWLDNVFGTKTEKKEQETPVSYQYEQEYQLSEQQVIKTDDTYEAEQKTLKTEVFAPTISGRVKSRANILQGRISKAQLTQGVLMAEILGKPKALRPNERIRLSGRKSAAI